ncbi:hypothetical protein LQE92_01085 [Lacrimispora sp. NSJ-141]|uniref:Uncharacterized protein n=1 Tax=Lientehia hominis TaxID=2897778 RepID=A0AAP2RI16_9FIRM|nr:hypothetical protein [Lientehia hominis]MCD2491220.1 hypothetical protein [Lientehia hominis]
MKKRYLCPVCEHELTAKSFCPECKRLRKEPIIYEGDFLPNESGSGAGVLETAEVTTKDTWSVGSYGSAPPRSSAKKPSPDTYRNTRYPDACGGKHTYGIPNVDPHRKKNTLEDEKKKDGSGMKIVGRLFFAAALILVVILCWEPIKTTALKLWKDSGLEAAFNGGNASEEESAGADSSHQDVDEEEILAAGEPCSGYSHYDVDGQIYMNTLAGYCKELWQSEDIQVSDAVTSNWISSYGDRDYTYYEKSVYVDIGDDTGNYFRIVSDTVTGEVMQVSVSASGRDTAQKLLLLAGCGLDPAADRNQLWQEVQGFFSDAEADGYLFTEWGTSDLYVSIDEGSYYCTLECLDEYDKY